MLIKLDKPQSENVIDFSQDKQLWRVKQLNSKKRKETFKTYDLLNNVKSYLNYIFINKRWINFALIYDAYSSFERVSSNLRNISPKINMCRCRNKKENGEAFRYHWSYLSYSDVCNQYKKLWLISLIFFRKHMKHISNNKFENYVTALIEPAIESKPTTPRAKCTLHWDSLALIQT